MATSNGTFESDADRIIVTESGSSGTESEFSDLSDEGTGSGGNTDRSEGTAAPRRRGRKPGSKNKSKAEGSRVAETWAPESQVETADPGTIKKDLKDGIQFIGEQLAVVGGNHWKVSNAEANLLAGPSTRIMEHVGQGQISFKASVWIVGIMGGAMVIARTVQTWMLILQTRQMRRQMGQTPIPPVYRNAFDPSAEADAHQPQNPDGYRKTAPGDADLLREQ